jgi:hypothetical protein
VDISESIGEINSLAIAPFAQPLPILPIALVFVLLLICAGEWRLIVDRIDRVI